MVFGLGTTRTTAKSKKGPKKASGRSNEAAAMLKKMKAKKDSGSCAFC